VDTTLEPARFQPHPPLSEDEYAALKEDIRKNGQIVPILIDEDGNILDGHHRNRICGELGIPRRFEVVPDLPDDNAKMEFALRVGNLRRHLSNEQKRELVRSELQRNPNRTDAFIAGILGVSASMVNRHRHDLAEEARREAETADWTPEYRAAIERMGQLMRAEVENWITICNCIADIGENYPDQFEQSQQDIGMDRYAASMMLHEIEITDWDRFPGLMRAYKRVLPFRQQLTDGITFTHENGWSDHPTPMPNFDEE